MARYEVFVPAAPPARPGDLTLHIDAEHWLGALKAGLERIGGQPRMANVLCDIRADGSIHVTDTQSTRVFRIREIGDAPAAHGADIRIGRGRPPPSAEDLLAELFERVSDLRTERDRSRGLAFLLDLAMEKIDCEAGSVFLARLGGKELEFAVARGPRAGDILRLGLTVPMGAGIVGFSAQENVCVAVSDAEKDPRFYRAISRAIGYETRSLLCAPMARKGRVLGAVEVLNKRGGRAFEQRDVSVLSYLAHQAAELLERVER